MCMIEDLATGRILVQHRLPKATNPWCGLTFPGGHVEAGESITASTVREIREETGLTVSNLRMCGVVEWETIGERTDGSPAEVEANSKYIVFMFRTSTYTGELNSSTEGCMEWMTLDEMRQGGLAPHMEEYIRVMLEEEVPQAYGISGSNQLTCVGGEGKTIPKYRRFSPKWFFQRLGVNVQSFQSKLSVPQHDLLLWYWSQNYYFRDSLLQWLSSCAHSAWNLPMLPSEYSEALPLLSGAGIIGEVAVIDDAFVRNHSFPLKSFQSAGTNYLRNGPNQMIPVHTTDLATPEKLSKRLGWTYVEMASPGGRFCELATRWQVQKAIEQFKKEHQAVGCHAWHDIKLLKNDGMSLTDCDILVRIGEHFYYLEVKVCSNVAESYRSGRQGKALENLLAKAENCTRIYCLGYENEPPFSQPYLSLSTLDKEFYDLISKDFLASFEHG